MLVIWYGRWRRRWWERSSLVVERGSLDASGVEGMYTIVFPHFGNQLIPLKFPLGEIFPFLFPIVAGTLKAR